MNEYPHPALDHRYGFIGIDSARLPVSGHPSTLSQRRTLPIAADRTLQSAIAIPSRRRFAICVGSNDSFFPAPAVEATRGALEAKGHSVALKTIKNHRHNYYQRSGEVNEEAILIADAPILEVRHREEGF